MNYSCEYCNKGFSQKSHYDMHKLKKKSCKKCDINFTTQYAYLYDNCIHIDKYEKELHTNPKCKNGHVLVYCKGSKNRAFFRHKNNDDVNRHPEMSEWHCKWQGEFKDTEVDFNIINEKQSKNRRADVVLSDKYILEVQHSNIAYSEIICRANDYKLHNKELIWIVDGNTEDVELTMKRNNTYLIVFKSVWKYKSFIQSYEFLLLDINEKIFKIPIRHVKNNCIRVNSFIPMNKIVNVLTNTPENIWSLWKDDNFDSSKLTIIQKGAGNGKTYGIWKDIILNFDKSLYIIVTKQNTAKDVILQELNDQAERKEYHMDNIEELQIDEYGRKHRITYKHKHSNNVCTVIIGTIDSLYFALSNQRNGDADFFNSLANSISKNGCNKMNSYTGTINYAGLKLKINAMTELWIDEAQDLPESYYNAALRLMIDTQMDIFVVGDKMQSLEHERNFMTLEEDNHNVNIIFKQHENINMRIEVPGLAYIINCIIEYKKYGCKPIQIDENRERTLIKLDEDVFEIFEQKEKTLTDKNKIDDEVDRIIEKVKFEVEKYNYKPNDFLFIFPIMNNNILANELETRLNAFWDEILGKEDDDERYVVLHKHEEGKVIDTSTSIHSTRIMSIRAAKGDGRKVVFLLNCTEKALKMLSNNKINLVYESHLNVGVTRAKRKIYFGLQFNNDDIHRRISKFNSNVEYKPIINKSFSLTNLIRYMDTNKCIQLLQNNNICDFIEEEKNIQIGYNKQVDWKYHCIRHSIYYMNAINQIYKYKPCQFDKSQTKTVIDKIVKLNVISRTPNEFYTILKSKSQKSIGENNLDFFPLCELPKYNKYNKKIKEIIQKITSDYKKNNMSIVNLSPLESCIFSYLIDIYSNKIFHNITPCMIYDIVRSFESNDDHNIKDLIEESECIKSIMKQLMETIQTTEDKNINWNIHHWINMDGNTDELTIRNKYCIIGNTPNKVHHLVFQTDYNNLNHWTTMIQILLERFIIMNANSNERDINNKTRFSNKKIITYLLILKKNKYEIINWDFENSINEELKVIIKNALITHFETYNTELFNYCRFVKTNKNKWTGYKSPYHYLIKEFENISYVSQIFMHLSEEINKGNNKYVKDLTDNEETFTTKLNEYIEDMCDTYLWLNKIDENVEW